MNRTGSPALAGLLAVASGAAVAELVAAVLGRPQAGTVVAVGAVLVDAAPTPVKELAVATLGTADKPVLLGGSPSCSRCSLRRSGSSPSATGPPAWRGWRS